MRGVILAGGRGTRLQEFTIISNKHLAPLYSHQGATPIIYFPIKTLVNSGITEILIISSQEHSGDIIEYLGDGEAFGADFTYKIQDMNNPKKPVGIASALKIAKGYTGNENFAVVLGDNYYEQSFASQVKAFEATTSKACVFLKEVEDIERFGCATISDGKVTKITEKPSHPESNLAVTGLYLYTPDVYNIAEKLKVSARGELEVTDINDFYSKNGDLSYEVLSGFWSDMGTPLSMIRTQNFVIGENDENKNN